MRENFCALARDYQAICCPPCPTEYRTASIPYSVRSTGKQRGWTRLWTGRLAAQRDTAQSPGRHYESSYSLVLLSSRPLVPLNILSRLYQLSSFPLFPLSIHPLLQTSLFGRWLRHFLNRLLSDQTELENHHASRALYICPLLCPPPHTERGENPRYEWSDQWRSGIYCFRQVRASPPFSIGRLDAVIAVQWLETRTSGACFRMLSSTPLFLSRSGHVLGCISAHLVLLNLSIRSAWCVQLSSSLTHLDSAVRRLWHDAPSPVSGIHPSLMPGPEFSNRHPPVSRRTQYLFPGARVRSTYQ